MTKWYVKDLASLTGVSVQTLHHYDRINLLKPSAKQENGYRLYSEQDLLKLQQILALKFFGFDLKQIKNLLTIDVDMTEHFLAQAEFLASKAKEFQTASDNLKNILANYCNNKSIHWENIIKLIEVYRMGKQLKNTWAASVFTASELKQYAEFENGLKTRFTAKDKQSFEENWVNLITEIRLNLEQDPTSEFGKSIGQRCMEMVDGLYGKEHANLKHSVWQNGYKKGKMEGEHFVDPAIIAWLDKACGAYYRGRIYPLLDKVSTKGDNSQLESEWNKLMEEMHGNDKSLQQPIIDAAQTDPKVSVAARKWLQKFAQS